MTRPIPFLNFLFVPVAAAGLAASLPSLGQAAEFSVSELYFELNNTDGDLGIHGKIDGGPWRDVKIRDSDRKMILNFRAWGNMVQQGVTELFFESAEPTFEELPPADFFARFPEGTYTISGWAHAGGRLNSSAEIRHVMAAPVDNITVSGLNRAPTCDDEDPDYDEALVPTIPAGNQVIIDWDPVLTSHPELGNAGPIEVERYEVDIIIETTVNGEPFDSSAFFTLPPSVTELKVPQEIIDLGGEFKFEILVKERAGGNQTAEESCFFVTT